MKNNLILPIIFSLLGAFSLTVNSALAMDYQDTPIPRMMGKNASSIDDTRMKKINPYKDSNEKLYAIVGKSQLIKFDEPVKRISITDPALADIVLLSPKELLLNGKKAGRTSLIFWGDSEKPVFFNLVIQQDSDAFLQAVNQVAPDEDVDYVFTDNGVIMSGKISTATVKKQITDIINAYNFKLLDLTESPTKQVLLEVKITEASRNFTRDLESRFSVGENYESFVKDVLGVALTKFSNANFNNGSGQYMYSNDTAKIAWAIKAGEQKGIIKILAEPKLLAVNGQAGSFNVGNEIPVPSQLGQYGNVSYNFKNTGVILNFTPTILEKTGRVILKLAPEISEIDSSYVSATGVPGFKTRKVDTTVELNDGETLIIAGLLSHNSSKSHAQIPWLGDIPFLGVLFSSMSTEKKDTELVIFITPRIVSPNTNPMDISL